MALATTAAGARRRARRAPVRPRRREWPEHHLLRPDAEQARHAHRSRCRRRAGRRPLGDRPPSRPVRPAPHWWRSAARGRGSRSGAAGPGRQRRRLRVRRRRQQRRPRPAGHRGGALSVSPARPPIAAAKAAAPGRLVAGRLPLHDRNVPGAFVPPDRAASSRASGQRSRKERSASRPRPPWRATEWPAPSEPTTSWPDGANSGLALRPLQRRRQVVGPGEKQRGLRPGSRPRRFPSECVGPVTTRAGTAGRSRCQEAVRASNGTRSGAGAGRHRLLDRRLPSVERRR